MVKQDQAGEAGQNGIELRPVYIPMYSMHIPGYGGGLPMVEQDQASEAGQECDVEADEAQAVLITKMDILQMGNSFQKRVLQQRHL